MTSAADALPSAMRPRVREHVFWSSVDDRGVYAFGCRGGFALNEPDIHRWIERLAPFLDGTRTLGDLAKSLTPERRRRVEEIVHLLHRHGMIEDLSGDEPHGLSDLAQRVYAGQIRYLAQHVEAAARRFEHYRRRQALLMGAGESLLALVQATLRSGVQSITIGVTGERVTDQERLRDILDEAHHRDPEQSWTWLEIDPHGGRHGDDQRLAPLIEDADLVVSVSDASSLGGPASLERLCVRLRKVCCQAIIDIARDQAWVGPVCDPETPGGSSWEGARRRIGHLASVADVASGPDPFSDRTDDDASRRQPPRSSAALVAASLSLRCFRHLCGVAKEDAASVVVIDLARLSTRTHRFASHPLAVAAAPRNAAQRKARIAELEAGPVIDDLTFARAAALFVDERVGILTSLDEKHYQQLPLWVTEAQASDPVGILAVRGVSGVVHGAALDFAPARHRAVRAALELYASAMLDERLVVGHDGRSMPSDAGSAPGARGWLWGWRLDGGGERLVPVQAVFDSVFGSKANGHARLPVGVASGPSWAAAIEAALLRRVAQVTLTEALETESAFPAIPLDEIPIDGAPLDAVGLRLLHILRRAGAQVTAQDITGRLQIPAFALYLGKRTTATAQAAGWTAADALRDGLERVLLAHQSALTGETQYAPPPLPPLPFSGSGSRTAAGASRAAGWPAWNERPARVAEVARALASRYGLAVAVPLDHDPALNSALPYAVRIVFAD